MNIVVDENIPFAETIFSKLGNVHLLPGRAIRPESVREATVLIVRSITKVDEALLSGSPVQFVGTATAGTDHIDQHYLKTRNILFASAAGANAESVANYVLSALIITAARKGETLRGKRLGIIGVGHIGKRVDEMARAIGMKTILNDPPLKRATDDPGYRSFQEACDADYLSFHVPLNLEGPDKTYHLLNAETLEKLKPSTVVINTSRGEVIDSKVFLQGLSKKKRAAPVFDVWENEPDIDWNLLKIAALGTPHIAGYALDSKIKGTLLIYETLCAALGVSPAAHLQAALLPEAPTISLDAKGKSEMEVLPQITRQAYDLEADDTRLRELHDLPEAQRSAAFDQLRKNYPVRRVFQAIPISIQNSSQALRNQITGLGFKYLH